VSSLAFSCDGQFLASGSLDGVVQVWDVSGNPRSTTLEGPGEGIEVRLLAFFFLFFFFSHFIFS
jgi:WD40 repeat protein